jgi:hypothetical protein
MDHHTRNSSPNKPKGNSRRTSARGDGQRGGDHTPHAKVRDRRQHPFFIIDNAVIDNFGAKMGPHAFMVYAVIARYAKDGKCFPKYATIADKTGMSRPTAINAVRQLVELGLLKVRKRFRGKGKQDSNLYVLCDVPAEPGGVNAVNPTGKGDLPLRVNGVYPTGKGDLPEQDSSEQDQGEQDCINNTAADAAADDAASQPKNHQQHEAKRALTDRGVAATRAQRYAKGDPGLVLAVVRHFDCASASRQLRNPAGFLCDMLANAEGYGFLKVGGEWKPPEVDRAPDASEVLEKIRAEMQRRREETQRREETIEREGGPTSIKDFLRRRGTPCPA